MITRRLGVTSPLTKGPDVREAQLELKQRKWLQGPVDGQYGPDSMRATKKAQYYMGFSLKYISGVYSPVLHSILTGKRELSPDQKQRRAERLKSAGENAKSPKRLTLRAEMEKRVGKLLENPPGSNRVSGVTDWYGLTGPWCAMVVTRCGTIAGLRAFNRGSRWAYCPYILSDARKGVNGVAITYEPVPGNVVLYDWDNDGIADHVGVFDKWENRSAGTFWTFEGNTSKTNASNGGNQEHNVRSKSDVIAFVHCHET